MSEYYATLSSHEWVQTERMIARRLKELESKSEEQADQALFDLCSNFRQHTETFSENVEKIFQKMDNRTIIEKGD